MSYFYGKSRGIKAGEKLKITIYEKGKMLFEVLPPDVKVDTSGAIQATLKWDRISEKLPSRAVYAVVQDSEDIILYNGAKTNGGVAITKKSALLGLAEYKSAVLVGKAGSSKKDNKNGICEAEARVRAFMRMLRVGEGTGELIKSYDKEQKKIVYISHDFQKGYTTAFNNNEITDLSKHPEKNYGGSTAAGAYQIMRYVWWELNGNQVIQQDTGEYIKTGIREEWHDYVKKYKIPDYKHESQDKLCIIIMKHYCRKLINTIIDNNIEKAIRDYASLKWASLPHKGDNSFHTYNGQPQPATPMRICIEHYEKFLKEELKDISNLHLKKGFLKEFNYNCCEDDISSDNFNLYKIDYKKKTYSKVKKSNSNDYKFEVYNNDVLEKTFTGTKNTHNLLQFPQTGPNWGRYGVRDASKTDGDNWIKEEAFAALLGFFFTLAHEGINETFYYNDISSDDGVTDLGHSTHKTGKDIDIRYPGCTNGSSQTWVNSKNYLGSESKLDEIMTKIYQVAINWDFINNYHYKKPFANTKGKATSVHQDHFHIGFK